MSRTNTPRSRVQTAAKEQKAAYQSRPTMAEYVRENMALLNRSSYFQRLIYLTKHKGEETDFNEKLLQVYEEIVSKCKENLFGERLTGFFLFYHGYSLVLLEGPEELLTLFFQHLKPHIQEFFEIARMIFVLNNVYQLFFDRIVWRSVIPQDQAGTLSLDISDTKGNNATLLRGLHKLCQLVADEIESGGSAAFEMISSASEFHRYLPHIMILDIVLPSKELPSLEDYIKLSSEIQKYDDYEFHVWPIPFDYIPKDIFVYQKYDVNLTFKDVKKK